MDAGRLRAELRRTMQRKDCGRRATYGRNAPPKASAQSMQNIWRMEQYYETYCDDEKLSTLSREISWSNNALIMMGAKTDEARGFYLVMAQNNSYTVREMERQMESRLFERNRKRKIDSTRMNIRKMTINDYERIFRLC
jgi:uncharacterized membrane protein